MPQASRKLMLLNVATVALMAIAVGLVFLYAPRERVMGEVQRIFYFHVPSAWVGFLAFFVALCMSIAFLRTDDLRWDKVSAASVEVGLVFTVMAIVSGSIWARPAWNTWWTWDPRLTTYTILALIYVAYLMLRQGVEDPIRRWRTIHPVIIGTETATSVGGFDMTTPMLQVFLFSLFAFTVLYFCFLANRLQLQREMDYVEQLRAQAITD